MHQDILKFWFEEIQPQAWWRVDTEFDRRIEARFGITMRQAACAELHTWRATAHGRLAEVIVLDQFSRNVYRGQAQAFASDPLALALSQEAVTALALSELNAIERTFLLMPWMHSESRDIHALAQDLFKQHTPTANQDFEQRHKVIIDRFGRYPHRNAVLGRSSTPEELEFLNQPGSHF
mgnify:CR=1 FL=1